MNKFDYVYVLCDQGANSKIRPYQENDSAYDLALSGKMRKILGVFLEGNQKLK